MIRSPFFSLNSAAKGRRRPTSQLFSGALFPRSTGLFSKLNPFKSHSPPPPLFSQHSQIRKLEHLKLFLVCASPLSLQLATTEIAYWVEGGDVVRTRRRVSLSFFSHGVLFNSPKTISKFSRSFFLIYVKTAAPRLHCDVDPLSLFRSLFERGE